MQAEPGPIPIIAGPTGAGKTALALAMSARLPRPRIINADALQIYAGLPILSAQPSKEQQKQVPHALYAFLQPEDQGSVAIYQNIAQAEIAAALAAGEQPILCGGTGLYIEALMYGIADIPAVPEAVAALVQAEYAFSIGNGSAEDFWKKLQAVDAESAIKIAPQDKQRLIRAMAVYRATGKPLSYWQKAGKPAKPPYLFQPILLLPEREALYARLDARFLEMLKYGALEEAAWAQTLKSPAPSFSKTLGLKPLQDYLMAKITQKEAIAAAQQATRNYAKRQYTWFRNRLAKHAGAQIISRIEDLQ